MLTGISIENFKALGDVEFELGKSVVLIGPNNSGKTTALQAISLWDVGLRRWIEKRGTGPIPKNRAGVAVNRNDLFNIPVPQVDFLWNNRHMRSTARKGGKQVTEHINIEIVMKGIAEDSAWECGLEFDYANDESLYVRPLRLQKNGDFMPIPDESAGTRVAYLPPMSGLADREFLKQPGEIGFLLGQGQTAQVLRNLCWRIFARREEQVRSLASTKDSRASENMANADWSRLEERMRDLFGIDLLAPKYVPERSEITMAYRDRGGPELDLSCAGRGLQQTLLLLAHLYENPRTVLLLDEPDAHLEVLRQQQTYQVLSEVADAQGSQIVAASHSEVVLSEAAERGTVIAFVGKPHAMGDKPQQVLKSLRTIGFDQYYLAEQTGWVLYLEGSTDLAILRAFARTLGHEKAQDALARPFVHYVSTNLPQIARDHFYGLREAKPDLAGIAIFDRLDQDLDVDTPLMELMWRKREIENYLCMEDVLLACARHAPWRGQIDKVDMIEDAESRRRVEIMKESIDEVGYSLKTLRQAEMWSPDTKTSDDVLEPVFRTFFQKMGIPPVLFQKRDFSGLASFVPPDKIDPEVSAMLDRIVEVSGRAKPAVP
ncbi:AAA family ATPase [Candidatus Sumerlaeota bacterium]|nr:AAA family ATPase [Candidatus Sumerlaeota bacterium]